VIGVLRFAGQLHPTARRMVVRVPVGSLASAVRLQRHLHDVYGCAADVLGPGGRPHRDAGSRAQQGNPSATLLSTGGGYQVLVTTGGGDLARRTGLTDRDGRTLRGLPPHIVNGGVCDAAALWRGAFLTADGIDVDGCNPGVVLTCASAEVAMALVDVARCLGVPARSK